MSRRMPAIASLVVLLSVASCDNLAITVSPPAALTDQAVTVSGPAVVSIALPTGAYAATFKGTAASYQWSMDGDAITGATDSRLSVDVTNPPLAVGKHWLSIVIADPSGIRYTGSLSFLVSN
jgi:hypothetical protein